MRIFTLCECAIMLALSVVLSYVKIFSLPFDGSITLFSMLPICLVSIKYGLKWGLGTAFCYSWFQILQGGVFAWGLTPTMLIASLFWTTSWPLPCWDWRDSSAPRATGV